MNHKHYKWLQVVLTLFYGHYVSRAVGINFILTIPDLAQRPDQVSLILKVCLGALMLFISIFNLAVLWIREAFRLMTVAGLLLITIFMFHIIFATVLFSRQYDLLSYYEKCKLLPEIIFDFSVQILAIMVTFFISS